MEDINGACRSFAKSVNDYIDRALRRRGRRHDDGAATSSVRGECNDLVRHANLVLVTLTAKHASLANALAALRAESKDYVERFSAAAASSSDVERVQMEIVRRWFAIYVRLRDGFVLLESGERRHDHDDDDDDSFPSRLNGGDLRSDGVTRMFKFRYTGRGCDEVYTPSVGIKPRLLEALSKLDRRPTKDIDEKLFDEDNRDAGRHVWTRLTKTKH